MTPKDRFPVLIIDVVGGSVVVACVLASGWLALVRTDRTRAEVNEMTELVRVARQDLGSLRQAHAQQQSRLAKGTAELAERGQLPDQTPVEEYFQTLSELAGRHHLRMLRNNPAAPRQYPGLLEQRYTCAVTGSMPDLARFFRAIEGTDFWADISYFQIRSGSGAEADGSNVRSAELTISLFSALPVETSADNG